MKYDEDIKYDDCLEELSRALTAGPILGRTPLKQYKEEFKEGDEVYITGILERPGVSNLHVYRSGSWVPKSHDTILLLLK